MKVWLMQLEDWPSRWAVRRLDVLGPAVRLAGGAALFGLAFVVRAILPIGAEFPFLTFFPAMVLAALMFGFLPGLLNALLGAFAVYGFFMPVTLQTPWQRAAPPLVFLIIGLLVCTLADNARRQGARRREAEQRFRDVAASSVDWFWEADREFRFTYVSDNFARQTGRAADVLVGKVDAGCARRAAAGEGQTMLRDQVLEIEGNDGKSLEFVLTGVPFCNSAGVPAGYRGTARLVTPLVRAELAADRADRLLREAVEAIACGFTIYDENDRLVICNQAYRDVYRQSRELIVPGASFADIVREGARLGQYRAARGREEEWVRRRVAEHRHPDGRPLEQELGDGRWLLIVESRTPSGFIVGNRIDITEHKQTEIEQQRLTRALRLLTECNTAVVHAEDESGLLRDVCEKIVVSGGYAMAWIGFAHEDAERSVVPVTSFGDDGGYLSSIRVSWGDGSRHGCGPVGRAIRTGQRQIVHDSAADPALAAWQSILAERGYRSIVGLPLRIGGAVVGALAVYAMTPGAFNAQEVELLHELANNLSFGLQSLRSRQDLDRHRRDLERLVDERTEQISQLNRQLAERAEEAEAANRAKSDFLATMSHEIRTPINAVVGLTELLTETSLNRRQWDCVHKIQLSAESLRALIDDILDFSKIEAGALTVEQTPFSLTKILRALAAIVSVGARGKPIEIIFDIPRDIPEQLVGDSLRLQQILLNLTNNAVKFTETGDIVIAIRQLAADESAVTLEFSVADTGIGIPADKLSRIFEVFTQADSSISRTHGGSGLGLAICARLAELMDGSITVDSEPGRGSQFRLTARFPLAPAGDQTPTDALAGLALLVVDDHPLVRDGLLRACAEFGWRAMAVDSGAAALAELARSAAAGEDYDLMLLDWRMPGMDGLQMLRQARQTPGIGLPLVVLMACASEVAEAIAASDDDYLDGVLAKPIWPASLYEAVKNTWSGEFPELQTMPVSSDRRLAGLRFLVAEDNEINRELIEGILLRAGAQVELAVNGEAAVAAVRRPGAHFDCVLMDIQMPVMDGFAATRVIRDELGRHDLTIIAVTAHAGTSDIERSRQVGMNGLVLKPVQVEDLLDFLADTGRGLLRSTGKKAEIPLLDLPGIEPNALDRFDGNAEYYAEILRQFASRHAGEVAEATALFTRGEYAAAGRLVHQLGGVAAFLRATDLPRITVRIEKALAGNPVSAAPLFAELAGAMAVLLDSIARFDTGASGESPAAPRSS